MAKRYIIFVCGNCGLPLFTKETQKTRKCPRCDYSIKIGRARKIGYADDGFEASKIVRFIKLPKDKKGEFKAIDSGAQIRGSKRDRFMRILLSLTEESGGKAIPENEIIRAAKNKGLEEEWVDNQLIRLERNGLLLRPKEGFILFLSQ
ncbi:MAG: DUF1922 domain-containing protein [Promethearchaeota archaeon]